MALSLDGRPVARALLRQARDDLATYVKRAGRPPELAVVLAGRDESSVAYLKAIRRTFSKIGLGVRAVEMPSSVDEHEFRAAVDGLNADPSVNGILVLQPLPPHLPAKLASDTVDPTKDVDGVTPLNAGRLVLGLKSLVPSTPAGGLEILRHYGIPIEGQHAVVLGRSPVVGMPMAHLLLAANATVTICHSRTLHLAEIARSADLLVAATGRPGIVTPEMVKPGATVVDFGVNFIDGRMVGDVDPAVEQVAGALTPVPGGTGAVTNAILIRNTIAAAWNQLGGPPTAALAGAPGWREERGE